MIKYLTVTHVFTVPISVDSSVRTLNLLFFNDSINSSFAELPMTFFIIAVVLVLFVEIPIKIKIKKIFKN